ncbi:MAG: hypothetical protein QNJ42_13440 [Crocosphaera sp.]|nr:hypothetical protein [Crocosphaera sp.]
MKTTENWLDYYSQLRQYKESLEQKFLSLLFQQGVVAFSAATVIYAIQDIQKSIAQESIIILLIGLVATVGLWFYYLLTTSYFLHIRYVSEVMVKVEEKLNLSEEMGIKQLLSTKKKASIYTKGGKLTLLWIRVYGIISMIVVMFLACLPILTQLI